MDIIMAFLAFSAVMIVLSTITTVLVEAVHKFSRQRAHDFDRMLMNYYKGALVPLIVGAVDNQSKHFVDTIRRNPAFAGEHGDHPSPHRLGRLFDTAYETLTTPQFVEQLARSNVGKKISHQLQQGEAHIIEQLAAEFERYGDAATDYFHRRAKVLSIIASMLLAFALNVDALKLFQSLSSDHVLAKTVFAQINVSQLEKVYADAVQAKPDEAEKFEDTLRTVRADIQQNSLLLAQLDLPMGHAFFPYCLDSVKLQTSKPTSQIVGNTPTSEIHPIDTRCSRSGGEKMTHQRRAFEYVKWFFGTLMAGLLIGLGAPFWFKTYSYLVDFVPGINRGKKTETRSVSVDAPSSDAGEAVEGQDNSVLVSNDSSTPSTAPKGKLTAMFHSASGVSIDTIKTKTM